MVSEVPKGRVQLCHLLGARAFLRAENRRGTVGAAQGIVDVGGDFKTHLCQARVQLFEADMGQARQRQPTRRQWLAFAIQ